MPQTDLKIRHEYNSEYSKKIYTQKRKKKKEQNQKNRKRSVNRNRKYIETYKLNNPCPCGEATPCCLSFHHKNGDKIENISDMVNRGYGISRIQKEVDKCAVLCLNCHAKLHNKEKNNIIKEKKLLEEMGNKV